MKFHHVTSFQPVVQTMCLGCYLLASICLQVPALLCLPTSVLGPSSVGGTPVDTLLNICATYEWYTSQWLVAAAKERQPQQMTNFAAMHS